MNSTPTPTYTLVIKGVIAEGGQNWIMITILTVAITIMAVLAVATATTTVNAQQQVPNKDCAFNPSLA